MQKKKLYDFYFSAKQAERIGCNTVDGVMYTEMIEKGKQPVSRIDDAVLVHSGAYKKINVNPLKLKQ